MNQGSYKTHKKSYPAPCGYCDELVIWHKEWRNQRSSIPLNDMERGGGRHRCSKYAAYERMLVNFEAATSNTQNIIGAALLEVINEDSLAPWLKKTLRARIHRT